MVNLKSGVKKRVLFDKNGVPQLSHFDVKLENGGENPGQWRSWKEWSNQSLAKDHERGETQDVRVDSNTEQVNMPLKLMMNIPNRLKTMAAKVFDVLLKENGVKFRNGKFDMCILTCSNSKKSCQDSWSPENLPLISNFLKRIATS